MNSTSSRELTKETFEGKIEREAVWTSQEARQGLVHKPGILWIVAQENISV